MRPYPSGMDMFPSQLSASTSIVTAVLETPCYGCHRLARYTVLHRADARLLERFATQITHGDVHEIIWELEHLHPQVAVGLCQCGAAGQETTSLEFVATATREDLGFVAPDLSFEICSLSVDGRLLWQSDAEFSRHPSQIAETPDPTPEQFFVAAETRIKILEECSDLSAVGRTRLENAESRTGYIQAKARLYCRVGADKYRRQDALGEPDETFSTSKLATITTAMEQLAEGHGLAFDDPLEGVGASTAHALVRTLHFQVVAQHAQRSEDGLHFIDALTCQHIMNAKQRVTIFNRVPTAFDPATSI